MEDMSEINELKEQVARLDRLVALQVEYNEVLLGFIKAEVLSVNNAHLVDSLSFEYRTKVDEIINGYEASYVGSGRILTT